MNTLQDFKFRDLLPSSVRDASKFVAAAQCLDELVIETDKRIKNAVIYARIDEITDEALLANLAAQFHIEAYEGFAMAESLDEKRALIKNAIMLHMHKGTRWSVERIFELLNMRGVIVEWWEQPDDPEFEPYTFDIDIESDRVLTDEFISDCIRMVNALKNVRSHLRQIKMITRILSGIPIIGITAMNTTETTVMPRIVGEATVNIGVYLGIGEYGTAHTAVYPLAI